MFFCGTWRYLAVLPSTQDCGRRLGPDSKTLDFVLPIAFGGVGFVRDGYAEDVSDALLDSEHNLVAMCAERNAGLGGASIPPYRLLLIFSLRAHHKRDRR